VEKAAGEPHGRPRVKLTRIAEMLEVAARDADTGAAGSASTTT
jgi:hypothetical protein